MRSSAIYLLTGLGMALLCLCAPHATAQAIPFNHPDGSMHWYQPVAVPTGITWDAAHAAALAAGGHLATITSQAENDFVFGLVDAPEFWSDSGGNLLGPWLGGLQPVGSPEPAGNWRWATGEPFVYANWAPNEPNDAGGQDRIHFGVAVGTRTPLWDDLAGEFQDPVGYVIEWSGWPPDQTVGRLHESSAAADGYTLFSPILSDKIYLIDNDGRVVQDWTNSQPQGYAPYLLDNGDVLRMTRPFDTMGWNVGGIGARIERQDWNGNTIWQYDLLRPEFALHHDIEVLPNGNILMIAWERKNKTQAMHAGRDPSRLPEGELWPGMVIEVAPTGPTDGMVVWEWHAFDHVIQDFDPTKANFGPVAAHPELIDINYVPSGGIADWMHTNAVDYNPQLDQIMISVRGFDEIWVIDHSTTTLEARGHTGGNSGKGGDLLYRWGNSQAYRAGSPNEQKLFGQHDAQWIPAGHPGAGNILIFNNGLDRPAGEWTSIDEIAPPVDVLGNYTLTTSPMYGPVQMYGPDDPIWSYTAVNRTDFYSSFISGMQRQLNGNTLICDGAHGRLFEVTPAGEIAWTYINPMTRLGATAQGAGIPDTCFGNLCNLVFRANRYPASHPGLLGRDLSPGDPIETYAPEIEARFGSVNLGNASRADVLHVNGKPGDIWRETWVHYGEPVSLSITTPPAGPTPADYVLYVLPYEAGPAEVEAQPFGLGTAAMPLPLLNGLPLPAASVLANTLGFEPIFGAPFLTNVTSAPATIFQSNLAPGAYTIQGFILDNGSAGPGASVTNAVVVHVL